MMADGVRNEAAQATVFECSESNREAIGATPEGVWVQA